VLEPRLVYQEPEAVMLLSPPLLVLVDTRPPLVPPDTGAILASRVFRTNGIITQFW